MGCPSQNRSDHSRSQSRSLQLNCVVLRLISLRWTAFSCPRGRRKTTFGRISSESSYRRIASDLAAVHSRAPPSRLETLCADVSIEPELEVCVCVCVCVLHPDHHVLTRVDMVMSQTVPSPAWLVVMDPREAAPRQRKSSSTPMIIPMMTTVCLNSRERACEKSCR